MVPDFLPFHQRLSSFLQTRETAIWDWFASDELTEKAFDDHRLVLLKSSVRLDTDSHAALHAQAREVADGLGIEAPVALYQGTDDRRNAALVYTPGEVNLLFQGDTLERLTEVELRALLGHEMAHYLHLTRDEGRFFTADRMLAWICGEPGAHQAHARSLWLSQLYQEIHADRVALQVCDDRDAAISLLIKVTTGLTRFSVDAYLKQAREALELNDKAGAEGATHPETYIRAIALDDWARNPDTADDKLATLVEGAAKVDRLDLLAQEDLTGLTRLMLSHVLCADWARAEAVEAHAKAYFPDLGTPVRHPWEALEPLGAQSEDLRDYLAAVLLDFIAVDPELEDAPLVDLLGFARAYGLGEALEKRLKSDLGVTAKHMKKLEDALAASQKAHTPAKPIEAVEQVLEEPERPAPSDSPPDTPPPSDDPAEDAS